MEKDLLRISTSWLSILDDPIDNNIEEDIEDESGWNFIQVHSTVKPLASSNRSPSRPNDEKKKNNNLPFMDLFTINKNKILGTIYNNIYQRFPTDPPVFNKGVIWTLGASYELLPDEVNKYKSSSAQYPHSSRFLSDVERTFIWFTYRRDFPCIEEYNSTSDIGWGCMIRTGQMMLAKTLLIHSFSRDYLSTSPKLWQLPQYRRIIQLFEDNNSVPFSIHNLILQNTILRGGIDQKEIINGGEWFSPNKIAKTLEFVVNTFKPGGIVMYVPCDGIIYIDRVLSLCMKSSDKPIQQTVVNHPKEQMDDSLLLSFERNKIQGDNSFIHIPQTIDTSIYDPIKTAAITITNGNHNHQNNSQPHSIFFSSNIPTEDENWNPLYIMITSRIGLDKMNPIYIPHIQNLLRSKCCVGIIGGKPRESVYFIGYQDQHIIYLDPHFVQPYVQFDSDRVNYKDFQTYQCKVPLKMPIVDIDPSLAIGFFFSNRYDFDLFVQDQLLFAADHTPIFTVEQIEPDYVQSEEAEFKFINLNK